MIGLDILFVAIMGYGVFRGWHSGLLKQAFSLVGVYVGLLLAWALYTIIGEKVAPHLGTEVDVAKLFVFLLIWLGVPVACGIIATMLTRMVKFVYLGGLNGIAGAVLGGVKYLPAQCAVCAQFHGRQHRRQFGPVPSDDGNILGLVLEALCQDH